MCCEQMQYGSKPSDFSERSLVTDVEVPEYQSRENYDKEVMT